MHVGTRQHKENTSTSASIKYNLAANTRQSTTNNHKQDDTHKLKLQAHANTSASSHHKQEEYNHDHKVSSKHEKEYTRGTAQAQVAIYRKQETQTGSQHTQRAQHRTTVQAQTVPVNTSTNSKHIQ